MKSEDKIERKFDFEARQDRTVRLIGLIGFVAIGSIVLWFQGMSIGMIAIGALVLISGAVGYRAWDRERRRADAYKRRADELACLSGKDQEQTQPN